MRFSRAIIPAPNIEVSNNKRREGGICVSDVQQKHPNEFIRLSYLMPPHSRESKYFITSLWGIQHE